MARQERAWRADCVSEGVTPGRVFVDPDFSASKYATRSRPDFEALMEYIRGRNCEMVALWEVTRGSRQMREWVDFVDLCGNMGVLVRVFAEGDQQTYDSRRPRDREALLKAGIEAESEVEKIRSRTQAGTADAASEGRPAGPMPDGYKRIYGALTGDSMSPSGQKRREIVQVVDEERAWIYRAAAEGILNGVPANTVARILNAWEVPTATGRVGTWQGGALMNFLLKPSMEGHRVLGGTITKRHAWPAILDAVTAARLRQLRNGPRAARGHADTRLRHQLSGALLCGRCVKPMQGHLRGERHRYECEPQRGGCNRLSGPMAEIDAVVSRMVVGRLRDRDAMAIFDQRVDDAKVVDAEEALALLTSRRDELYSSAAKPGGPSMALVAAAERELLPQIETAQNRLRTLRTPPALRGYDPVELADRWETVPVGERRRVVLAMAELVLSPVGRGGSWSLRRLALSRWRGADLTWGEVWGVEPLRLV